MSIQIRIFMGYILNKEVKIHLKQSAEWKEAKLLGELPLIETYWQEKEYIGCFVPSLLTYNQLKEKEREVRTQLQIYCPKLNLDKHSIYLFSQLFLL